MSGQHIEWHVCPACSRRKATGRSLLVALGEGSEVYIGGKKCTAKGCHAESIRGVVIRARGVSIRTSPEAAEAVAAAIERKAAADRHTAANMLEDAAREEALAGRIRALHAV